MPVTLPTTLDSDLALAQAVVARDRKAAAEFVQTHSDPLYRYVRSRLQPRFEFVDDIVQEVFLTAWKSLPRYRGEAPLRSWLLGIARHKVEDHYRERLRNLPLPDDAEDTLPLSGPDLDATLDQARAQQAAGKILTALPEVYRLVLLWRYWEHRSAEEMAERTGKTPKAIERLLARARQEFRVLWLTPSV
ncbi:MAG: sigma-70 family RNA polymerase sigma factor [Acidobacteria bacterium]|nr:sigma-70 family RNA polymerase sigma factor [Acidobacteriota bacterium]